MTNYQHYNKEEFLLEFFKTKIYNQLTKDYKKLYLDISELDENTKVDIYNETRPSHRTELEKRSIFLYSMFYYLKFLTEINPTLIADIGCGKNLIKRYIPNIIGYDKTPEADIYEWFDNTFLSNNIEKFDCAFSINSMHFVSLLNFADRINEFGKIIKPSGRGYLSFNLARMVERTYLHESAQIFDLTKPVTIKHYRDYIVEELKKVKYNLLVVDLFDSISSEEIRYNTVKGAEWPTWQDWNNKNIQLISKNIIEEIKLYNFVLDYDFWNQTTKLLDLSVLEEAYNGNIKIVFEV